MTVWTIGLNHTTAPLDLRGRFAFTLDQISPMLASLHRALTPTASPTGSRSDNRCAIESAMLSTCNRTEIYLAGPGADQAVAAQPTLGWLAQLGGVSAEFLTAHTYQMEGDAAARHAFRVASGLDSMVLGEPQILGQFKDAVRAAEEAGALGSTLNQLFQRSFAVAKEVRSTTEIGSASISMAAASVRLASQLFEDLRKTRVLFVGAGEMIELSATHFAAKNPLSMAIANRSAERGDALANRFGASSMRLAELPERLHEFDIVISCTASTLPIIGLGAVERALKIRKSRPMFMVDMAVPRDIEPEVKALGDVYLYTVDDLAGLVQQGKSSRQAAVGQAEAIIDAGLAGFKHWVQHRQAVPLIQQLNAQAAQWRDMELERARKALARGEDVESVLQTLAKGITAKALHGAFAQLGTNPALADLEGGAADITNQTIQKLFLRGER